jgi:hypothetical protein
MGACMSLDNQLRASIAAQMLLPREEKPDPEALKRLELHLLQLRERLTRNDDDMRADHDQE